MPKPILRSPQSETSANNALNTHSSQLNRTSAILKTDPAQIKMILRKKRSQAYLDAMQKLDAGNPMNSQQLAEKVVQVVKNEFPDLDIENILLGSMAVCTLDPPLEVHTITINNPTIIHIPRNYPLGPALDQARSLALMPDYLCIEIYSHELRAISRTGAVATLSVFSAEDDWNAYQAQPTVTMRGSGESFI